VKEAAYKALYPMYKATWKELTYASFDDRRQLKPTLIFHPTNSGPGVNLHVSVSHDGEYIATTVLAERTSVS